MSGGFQLCSALWRSSIRHLSRPYRGSRRRGMGGQPPCVAHCRRLVLLLLLAGAAVAALSGKALVLSVPYSLLSSGSTPVASNCPFNMPPCTCTSARRCLQPRPVRASVEEGWRPPALLRRAEGAQASVASPSDRAQQPAPPVGAAWWSLASQQPSMERQPSAASLL